MPRKKFPANLVGPQIRKARWRLNLTQEQMATRCQMVGLDIGRSTLAQIEMRYRYVSDEELFMIASVLNVATDDLFPASLKEQMLRKKSTRWERSRATNK